MKSLVDLGLNRKEILSYFGVEDDTGCDIDDCCEYYWKYGDDLVSFADTIPELKYEKNNYYELDCPPMIDSWVYEGREHTLIISDDQTGRGNVMYVFSNDKKQNGYIRHM